MKSQISVVDRKVDKVDTHVLHNNNDWPFGWKLVGMGEEGSSDEEDYYEYCKTLPGYYSYSLHLH